jgi:hypothetical protein
MLRQMNIGTSRDAYSFAVWGATEYFKRPDFRVRSDMGFRFHRRLRVLPGRAWRWARLVLIPATVGAIIVIATR